MEHLKITSIKINRLLIELIIKTKNCIKIQLEIHHKRINFKTILNCLEKIKIIIIIITKLSMQRVVMKYLRDQTVNKIELI